MVIVTGIHETISDIQLAFQKAVRTEERLKRQAALLRVAAATPVDTGAAKASWRQTPSGVASDSEYMDELNHGTSQQAPTHFIEKAILVDQQLTPNGTIVLTI